MKILIRTMFCFLECRFLRGSLLYGHASVDNNKCSIHVSDTAVWRILSHQHPTLAQVDAIPQYGALRLSEHANC